VKIDLGHRFLTGTAAAPRHPPLKTAVVVITIVAVIIIIIIIIIFSDFSR